jgi:hypothetical protein
LAITVLANHIGADDACAQADVIRNCPYKAGRIQYTTGPKYHAIGQPHPFRYHEVQYIHRISENIDNASGEILLDELNHAVHDFYVLNFKSSRVSPGLQPRPAVMMISSQSSQSQYSPT